ncbi:hypothetical protein ACMSWU_002135 [Cronobacter turicensis]
MLEGYYDLDGAKGENVATQRKRLLAVQAALEIAKASVGSSDNATGARVGEDMKAAAAEIENLADVIQRVLDI